MDCLIDALARNGFAIQTDFLSSQETEMLRRDLLKKSDQKLFRPAGIGKKASAALEPEIRRDRTLWFVESELSEAQKMLWLKLEELRSLMNRELYLGLWDLEGHYAIYEPGGFYQKHRDRFANDDARTVSCVLYLNPDWIPDDGGELRLFPEGNEPVTIEPRAGTLVVFMSAELEHEVQTSNKSRLSFAGWFRTRVIA